MDHKPATDLALEYFKIGNAVVAFYVVQTLIFLNLNGHFKTGH